MKDEAEPSEGRGGFTLVEVVVALLVLTVGLLGLAGTTGYVVRQSTLSEVTTERATVLQSVVERVRAQPFASVGSGTMTDGAFSASWDVVASGTEFKSIRIVTTGPGVTSDGSAGPRLTSAVADTFTYQVLRP